MRELGEGWRRGGVGWPGAREALFPRQAPGGHVQSKVGPAWAACAAPSALPTEAGPSLGHSPRHLPIGHAHLGFRERMSPGEGGGVVEGACPDQSPIQGPSPSKLSTPLPTARVPVGDQRACFLRTCWIQAAACRATWVPLAGPPGWHPQGSKWGGTHRAGSFSGQRKARKWQQAPRSHGNHFP